MCHSAGGLSRGWSDKYGRRSLFGGVVIQGGLPEETSSSCGRDRERDERAAASSAEEPEQ